MSLVDSYQAGAFHPHRKPLPPTSYVPPPPRSQTSAPLSRIDGNQRSPTMSSYPHPQNINPVSHQAHMNQQTRRTLSSATSSTTSTGGLARENSTSSSQLQRSTSSRSESAPNSYVALMRKQKATVWCDRAQQEDPRLLAAQKAAKMRAATEIANANAARTGTLGGVRSKMRHHGVKAQTYAPGLHPGHGVPMRLSANEVEEDEVEEQRRPTMSGRYHHQRTESARSSLGSGSRQGSTYGGPTPPAAGAIASPPQAALSLRSSSEDQAKMQGSPASSHYTPQRPGLQDRDSADTDEAERENSFGGVGRLPQRTQDAEETRQNTIDDLRRRGSVDERSMTMSGYGRLFVANPDVDDD